MSDQKTTIDLHIHTVVSDGTDRPEELLPKIREKGIGLFSVTDHDDIKTCRVIRTLLKENDPRFLSGVEFSCRDAHGRYHILGYGYDDQAESMHRIVKKSHDLRMMKVQARLDYLKEEFGFTFPAEEIRELLAMDNPGKPHIGKMMVRHGYAVNIGQAIHDYINGIRFPNQFLKPDEAIRSILDAGGIPVLAHPCYGDGDEIVLGDELEMRLKHTLDYGLQGVEGFYSGFTDKLRNEVLGLAKKYSLYVTAGSDYHGENKLVCLGDTGLDQACEIPEGMTRFLEAAADKI